MDNTLPFAVNDALAKINTVLPLDSSIEGSDAS